LNNIGTNDPAFYMDNTGSDANGNPTRNFGTVALTGNWGFVNQNGGIFYLRNITTDSEYSVFDIRGDVFISSSDDTVGIKNYTVRPISLKDYLGSQAYINIWGTNGSPCTKIDVGGWTGGGKLSIGDFGSSAIPEVEELNLQPENINTESADVYLASVQINYIKGYNANIRVSPFTVSLGYPIIRDGWMRKGSLDMKHPNIPNWSGFILGYGANGLRLDKPTDVQILGYPGVSFKTGDAETPYGLTN
jgi:hypothetical protein